MSNIIDSIRMSGTTYAISDSGGTKVVEITQSDYDNLPTSAKTANIMYVITDAEPFDVSNYYTKDETSGATELATAFAATQPKLSAGTNITIDANNVISAEGGGGKAVSGGTNISITTGATADTINCTIPMSAGSTFFSAVIGRNNNKATATSALAGGEGCEANSNDSFTFGLANTAKTGSNGSVVFGFRNYSDVQTAFVCGKWNNMANANTSDTFGSSGNTLVAVGNGWASNDWLSPQPIKHNAFEIRQNGDIYIADTNDTSTSNFYEKPMIKLQDALGGGGGITSGDVQTMIDQSISGKTNQTDFVSHSGNTSIHVTTAQTAAWDAKSDFSGSYNDLTDKPTIPTSASQLTNDSGYITSSALNGYATEDYVTAATNDMATKTWVGQQGYLTEHQSLSNYYTKSETSGATEISTALGYKTDTTAVTQSINEAVSGKANSADIVDITGFGTQNSDTLIMTREKNGSMIAPLTVVKAGSGLSISVDAWANKSFDVDTTVIQEKLVSGTNIKTINNESILGSGNITIEGGGGKAIVGGRGITVTSGETADTVSFNLEIGNLNNNNHSLALNGWIYGTGSTSNSNTESGKVYGTVFLGGYNKNDGYNGGSTENENMFVGSNNQIRNTYGSNSDYNLGYNVVIGKHNNITGYKLQNSVAIGFYNSGTTSYQLTCGYYNKTSNVRETSFGSYNNSVSASTTFGNSGNTLFSVGNGTSSARHNAFEIKQNGDIYVPNTDDTSTANWYQKPMVRLQDTITALGGLKLVKLTQSEYDSLSTKDNSTLYVIVN